MVRILIIILFFLSFFSCKQYQLKQLYVKQPAPEPINSYSNNNFEESFFKEQHFSYKEFVQIDSHGNFKFVYPDGKINNDLLDTAKYYHTAEAIILTDIPRFYLRNCKATLTGDTLNLVLSDAPFSQIYYELSATKIKTSVYFKYYQTFSMGDSSYKLPVFSIFNQSLLLDKKEYTKGDSLKAKITVKLSACHTSDSVFTDTIKIYGLIKTIVD